MKKIFVLIAAIIAAILLYLIVFFLQMNRVANKAGYLTGTFHPDISALPDGKYSGRFNSSVKRFDSEVSFEIKDHQLGIIHFAKLFGTPGYGAPQQITAKIEESGELDFDAVSGATITGNFAKAAILDALEKGPR